MPKFFKSIYFQMPFGLLVLSFLIQKFTEIESLHHDFDRAFLMILNHFPIFLVIVFLMIVNWLLEAWKWHFITNLYNSFSVQQTLKAIGSGLLSSLVLPFRVGESVGRGLTYDAKVQLTFGFASVISSQFQNIIIIFMGIMALFFIKLPSVVFSLSIQWILIIGVALIFFACLIIMVYKNKIISKQLVLELKRILKLKNFGIILILSIVRYFVYCTQFAVFIGLYTDFSVDIIARTFIFYFLLTLSPALSFGKLGIREGIAILVFQPILNASIIILVSGLIWIINIGIPAIITLGVTAYYRFPVKSNKRVCLA